VRKFDERQWEISMSAVTRGIIYLLWAVGRPLAQLAASTVDYLGEMAVRVRGSFGGG